MTEQNSRRVSRRSLLQSTAALVSVPFVAKPITAWAEEKIAGTGEVIVYSYGGSFTERVRQYVFEPYSKATGIRVVDVTADLAEPQIKAMSAAERVD
jgi:putative spermidine/putrescine transport system substrate-binding protein